MTGVAGYGGAVNSAAYIRQHLIFVYSGTVGNSDAKFMMAGQYAYGTYDGTHYACEPTGAQWQLHGEGEMVSAWAEMAHACQTYSCPASSAYYNSLADELARSIMNDESDDSDVYKNTVNPPAQVAPTVDNYEVLSEPCTTSAGNWPYGCDLGTDAGSYKPWLISKGIFEQAIYCLNNQYSDSQLGTFISTNATAIAGLSHFGFWWDNSDLDGSTPVVSATQTSVLDGLDADLGTSYVMCHPA